MGVSGPETSPTLLGQLRRNPTNETAWRQFVQLYGGHIAAWCRTWGLQDADAEDVTQATLLRLVKVMQSFEYDSTRLFRGWLKTVTHRVWQDLARSLRRVPAKGTEGGTDPFAAVAARDELAGAIEAAYDRELFEVAAGRVRLRVQPQTWEAFKLTAIDGEPATVAAERLNLRLTTVYKARNNVQKMLREEIVYLEERSA
jgi:RNA polymerase sigma-70 factor (ECF subfamily)